MRNVCNYALNYWHRRILSHFAIGYVCANDDNGCKYQLLSATHEEVIAITKVELSYLSVVAVISFENPLACFFPLWHFARVDGQLRNVCR